MPRTRQPRQPESRRQTVELARAGRSPKELALEFNPSTQTIRNSAELDEDRR
jgi:transposase